MANVSVLTVANGRLANESISICAPYYESYWFGETWAAYSGGALNPYYGRFGALLAFGQGHSAGNNNQVPALVLGEVCAWKTLTTPSAPFGTGTDATTRFNNAHASYQGDAYTGTPNTGQIMVINATAEMQVNGVPTGQPAAPHSYNGLVILEPSAGAPNGTLFTPMITAALRHANPTTGSVTAYSLSINSTAAAGALSWRKLYSHPTYPFLTPANSSSLQGIASVPFHTVYDAPSRRVFYETGNPLPPRWYALNGTSAAAAYIQGTGAVLTKTDHANGSYAHMMIGIPERRLAIMLYKRNTGFLGARWMDLSAAQPSWINTGANITLNIPLDNDWSSACWCVDNGCIIIGDVQGDRAVIAEILLPTSLTDPWVATMVPLSTTITTWLSSAHRYLDNCNVYGKFAYSPALKCIPFFNIPRNLRLPDVMYAIRPRGV